MVLEITTGLMTHLTTRALKSCKTSPPLDQIPVKALPARRVAHVTQWVFFPVSTFVNIRTKKFNCLDMDRKWIHKNEKLGNVYSFQKPRKY